MTKPANAADPAARESRAANHSGGVGGFSLLELVVVVAIIALLTAVAVPSYRDYVLRSRRSEAIIALTELANLQEKYYSQYLHYVINDASIVKTPNSVGLHYPRHTPLHHNAGFDCFEYAGQECYYVLSVAAGKTGDNQSYQLTATHNHSQTADKKCKTFTLDNAGRKGATDSNDQGGEGSKQAQICWEK